ncbi:MAG: hypothetical protein JXR37_13695 [Kiritimatiellae bacterium]|nr:hypothetical protein [Kiritimatiellia bacterium]
MFRHVLTGTAVLGLALTAGCGRRAEEQRTGEAPANRTVRQPAVAPAKEHVSIRSKNGEFTLTAGEAVQIPAGFPKDVLIYGGAKIELATRAPKGYTISLRTPDAVETVTAAYKTAMIREHWRQDTAGVLGGQAILCYKKPGRTTSIVIALAGDDTQIMLTVVAP